MRIRIQLFIFMRTPEKSTAHEASTPIRAMYLTPGHKSIYQLYSSIKSLLQLTDLFLLILNFNVLFQNLIVWLLKFFRSSLPIGGSLVGALLQYLPEYQKVYFYTWSQ
jgi:hypothetical protein